MANIENTFEKGSFSLEQANAVLDTLKPTVYEANRDWQIYIAKLQEKEKNPEGSTPWKMASNAIEHYERNVFPQINAVFDNEGIEAIMDNSRIQLRFPANIEGREAYYRWDGHAKEITLYEYKGEGKIMSLAELPM